MCHSIDHADSFKKFATNGNFHSTFAATDKAITSCKRCHGENLQGAIALDKVTPTQPCTKCHSTNPTVANASGCASCHGTPPNGGADSVSPNRGMSHAVHRALPPVNSICNSCHNGAGTGTVKHYDVATVVAFLPAYNAKQGQASSSVSVSKQRTCSNVSCHGGKPTPAWGVSFTQDTDDRGTHCMFCHDLGAGIQDIEYNNYYSGLHAFHRGLVPGPSTGKTISSIACIDCHNEVSLKTPEVHFSGLKSHTFTAPQNTIGEIQIPGDTTAHTKIGSYVSNTGPVLLQGCGTVSCHPNGYPNPAKWFH